MSATLFDPIVVHCFSCPHTVESTDPDDAHDRMEEHYAEAHTRLIEELTR